MSQVPLASNLRGQSLDRSGADSQRKIFEGGSSKARVWARGGGWEGGGGVEGLNCGGWEEGRGEGELRGRRVRESKLGFNLTQCKVRCHQRMVGGR